LLVIRWSDGRESRVTTAGVLIIADRASNNEAAPANEAKLDLQVDEEDGEGSEDVIFDWAEIQEEEFEGDLSTKDKKIVYLLFSKYSVNQLINRDLTEIISNNVKKDNDEDILCGNELLS